MQSRLTAAPIAAPPAVGVGEELVAALLLVSVVSPVIAGSIVVKQANVEQRGLPTHITIAAVRARAGG